MDIVPNKRKWTEREKLRRQLNNAKRAGCKADLTIEQWTEALEYFNHSCAYCGLLYQVIEHYIPLERGGGTTVSNCVPACTMCNVSKDARNRQLIRIYDNQRVIDFLASKGAVIRIHVHEYKFKKNGYVDEMRIYCDCGYFYEIRGNENDAQYSIEIERGRTGIVTAS